MVVLQIVWVVRECISRPLPDRWCLMPQTHLLRSLPHRTLQTALAKVNQRKLLALLVNQVAADVSQLPAPRNITAYSAKMYAVNASANQKLLTTAGRRGSSGSIYEQTRRCWQL